MDIKQRIKQIALSLLVGASPMATNAQTHEPQESTDNPVEYKQVPTSQDKFSMSAENSHQTVMSTHHQTGEIEAFETASDNIIKGIRELKQNPSKYAYKYIPASQDNFWEVATGAVKIIKEPQYQNNKFYQELCRFYDNTKGKDVDLNDPTIRKIFLACKKITKNHTELAENSDGTYNEQSYLLGIDAKAFYRLTQNAPISFHTFCKKLYDNQDRFKMLDSKDAPQAEKLAEQLLREKLDAYNISSQDTSFCYTNFKSAVYTNDLDNEWNDWNLQLHISPQQLDSADGKYCPTAIIKAHELGHIMQKMPGAREEKNELAELAPTIELIVMQDIVYKKINNIPLSEEVKYPESPEAGINMGKIANTFRTIKEKNNLRSYEDVLLTPEAGRAINTFETQNIAANILSPNVR